MKRNQAIQLIPNDKKKANNITILVKLKKHKLELTIEYILIGNIKKVLYPKRAYQKPKFKSGLWKTTVFEIFLRSKNTDCYVEWNFALNKQYWNMHFADYRKPLESLLEIKPKISIKKQKHTISLKTTIPLLHKKHIEANITAITKLTNGATIYWCHKKLQKTKIDFHDFKLFTLDIA